MFLHHGALQPRFAWQARASIPGRVVKKREVWFHGDVGNVTKGTSLGSLICHCSDLSLPSCPPVRILGCYLLSLLWLVYGKMGQTWEELNFQYYQNSPAKTFLPLLGATTHKKYPPMFVYFHGKVGVMDSACRRRLITGCTIMREDKNVRRRGSRGHHIQQQCCRAVPQSEMALSIEPDRGEDRGLSLPNALKFRYGSWDTCS